MCGVLGMKEVTGNIWDYHGQGHWIVITTNGNTKSNGESVMGRGIALQAKEKLPQLPLSIGRKVRELGNYPHYFPISRVITFPTKHNWWEKSDMKLIERSAVLLVNLCNKDLIVSIIPPIYMTRPGCSNGGLDWKDVKSILEDYLDDRFVIVEKNP